MSVQSVLRGCRDVLTQSADVHRGEGMLGPLVMTTVCAVQAEAVTRLLAELEKEEETSDGKP